MACEEAELYVFTVQTSQPGDDLVPVVEALSARLAVGQVARRATVTLVAFLCATGLVVTGWPRIWKTWKPGILREFSEPGKLREFSGNSVQPQGKL